jgi:hypothetical protein
MVLEIINENLGEIKFGSKVTRYLDISKYAEDYHYHDVDCRSCTKAERQGNKLKVTIDSNSVGATAGVPKVIHKYVTIYLDPNTHQYIADDNYLRVDNPDKKEVKFMFSGFIS